MRLALLTGGSRGLGLALHEALSRGGYRVIEFSRSGSHAGSVQVDLSDPAASRARVACTLSDLDPAAVDELLVIHNAGALDPIGPASRKDPAAVLANLQANFTSPVLLIAEVVGYFQAAPCRKVLANISSGAALKGYAGWSLYCAAKAGLENHIRALALEQQTEAQPFTPINIDPGVMDTDMQALIRRSSVVDFPDLARFIRRKEQGALVAPAEVAAAVCRILALPTLTAGGRYDVAEHGA